MQVSFFTEKQIQTQNLLTVMKNETKANVFVFVDARSSFNDRNSFLQTSGLLLQC